MGCLGGGWLAGSLAERHEGHQHRAARARHPDAIGLDARVQLAAVLVLEDEGLEGGAEVGGRQCMILAHIIAIVSATMIMIAVRHPMLKRRSVPARPRNPRLMGCPQDGQASA